MIKRIVCLTEESVETLFAIGAKDLICGVSIYVKRPKEACQIQKISTFIDAKYDQITNLTPDLVLGHSDIQKNIASELIDRGLNVFIANHRSVEEILDYINLLGRMVDKKNEAKLFVKTLEDKIEETKQLIASLRKNNIQMPRVYIEEWDEPLISGIRWFSEIAELCGATDIFSELKYSKKAKDRFVQNEEIIRRNPDIILACWCGKKVKKEAIKTRENYQNINAVKNDFIVELTPEIFLQPGPAPIIEGIDILLEVFDRWRKSIYSF